MNPALRFFGAFVTFACLTGGTAAALAQAYEAPPYPPSAYNQPGYPAPAPRPPMEGGPVAEPDWGSERFERQSFREEMEEIRHEHDDLDRARDQLNDQCGPHDAPQSESCLTARETLQQRCAALRLRRQSLRQRMTEARIDRAEGPQSLWPPTMAPLAAAPGPAAR